MKIKTHMGKYREHNHLFVQSDNMACQARSQEGRDWPEPGAQIPGPVTWDEGILAMCPNSWPGISGVVRQRTLLPLDLLRVSHE